MPRIDAEEHEALISIEGTPVDMLNPPEGCGFGTRCEYCMKLCLKAQPPVVDLGNGHFSKCWLLTLKEKEVICASRSSRAMTAHFILPRKF